MYTRKRGEAPLRIPEQYGGTAFSEGDVQEFSQDRTYMPRKMSAPPGFPARERLSPMAEEALQGKEPAWPEAQEGPEWEQEAVPVCEAPLQERAEAGCDVPEHKEAQGKPQEGFLGREELLLLVLALLMLGEDGGDSMLGYLLLGMMFLK